MLHVPVLPLELIVEILSWVPVKSLMRFRCVSKAWNCLIFDPALVKLQLQRCSKNSHILLRFLTAPSGDERGICLGATPCSIHCFLENTSSTIDDSIYLFNRANSVFGSCNGLVCLCESFVGIEFGEYKVRFWNPTTRTMSQYSPSLLLRSTNYQIEHCSLRYGFGFDDWSHTYKVVVVLMDIKSHTKEVRVHCLGETCWRKTLTFPSIPFLSQVDGQYMSGTVNWLALRRTVTTDQLVIFSYDLKKETYRYLLMPKDDIEVSFIEPYLGVMKGCLCLSHDHKRTHFVVWLMREYGVEKCWTQLFKLSYEHLHNHGLPPCRVMPLCMSHDEDVVMLADYGGFKFVLYNRRAGQIDRTEGFNYNTFSFMSFDYVQSLVLPYQISATLNLLI